MVFAAAPCSAPPFCWDFPEFRGENHINHQPLLHRWCWGWMKSIPFLPEVKQIQGICLECHHPNHLLGLTEMKSSIPLWQEDATGVWWVWKVQSPTAFYWFALSAFVQPCSSLFTPLKQWIFYFLSNKTGKSVLRTSSTLQNPIYKRTQRDVSPNFHTCPWPWAAGTHISCLAPGLWAALNDQEKNTRALNSVTSQPWR